MSGINNIYDRLLESLPPWFGQDSPVINAIVAGMAATDVYIFNFIEFANKQTRIKTATGIYLDIISKTYFGDELPRRHKESDEVFRRRILAYLLTEKATREGIKNIITQFTGFVPTMIEGFDVYDTGAYDASYFYDEGFGSGGGLPYTGAIYALIPSASGFFGIGGYDADGNGFGYDFKFRNAYVDNSVDPVIINEAMLRELIENIKVYGTYIYLYVRYAEET